MDKTNFRDEMNKYFEQYGLSYDELSPVIQGGLDRAYYLGTADGLHGGYLLACDLCTNLPKRNNQQ